MPSYGPTNSFLTQLFLRTPSSSQQQPLSITCIPSLSSESSKSLRGIPCPPGCCQQLIIPLLEKMKHIPAGSPPGWCPVEVLSERPLASKWRLPDPAGDASLCCNNKQPQTLNGLTKQNFTSCSCYVCKQVSRGLCCSSWSGMQGDGSTLDMSP